MCGQTEIRYTCFGCGKTNMLQSDTLARSPCLYIKWKSLGSSMKEAYWGMCGRVNHDVETRTGEVLCSNCKEARERRSGVFAEMFWLMADIKKSMSWFGFVNAAFGTFISSPWDLYIFFAEILEDPAAAFANIPLSGLHDPKVRAYR
ncbi:hypothetical protein KJ359_005672 [Pestalotiopsis sp. 9143b]|nr:hypothetical protein KJ359_005672 [Pestalotiopsis sp. 9143b]